MSLYVYAVLDRVRRRGAPRELRGVAGESVRLLRVRGVAVAAGRVAERPAASARTLRRHDAVVRALASVADAVLPVRFGALLEDARSVGQAIDALGAQLADALALVAGREQMTVRVFADAPPPLASPAGAADGTAIDGDGPGTAYLGARLQASRRARAVPELEPIRAAVADLVAAERTERHAHPPLLASVYHLIPRGASARYLAAVRRAARAAPALRVHVSGPWPAYSFFDGGVDGARPAFACNGSHTGAHQRSRRASRRRTRTLVAPEDVA